VLFNTASEDYKNEWLLFLEIFELVYQSKNDLSERVQNKLNQLKENKKYNKLIEDGMRLLTK
jgi:phenylalanine-4-hydroxylase